MKIAIFFSSQVPQTFPKNIQQICEKIDIKFYRRGTESEEAAKQAKHSFTYLNSQELTGDYDFIITVSIQDFNSMEQRLLQLQSKTIKQVAILNMFHYSQTENYNFDFLADLLQVIVKPTFQVQNLCDFFKQRDIKFLFKDLFYK